jgi:putative copper export protein
MPSLFPMIRLWIVILACVLTYIHAQAGSGHAGGRDEEAVVRTADLLALHTFAMIVILAGLTLIACSAARISFSKQRQRQATA